jgi:putative GTP pyrophosphokinase
MVKIYPYSRDRFDQALAEVQKFEEEAAQGKKIEPVLVSAGPLDQLRRAYPNFFLDIGAFDEMVRSILNQAA